MTSKRTDDRCREEVWERGGYHRYQCSRKAVKDGYCKQHHPDTKAERDAKNHAAWEEKKKKQPWYVINELKKELEAARKEVERLKEWQREMVEKAADKSLSGYRELGEKCAALEKERDDAITEVKWLKEQQQIVSMDLPDERTLTREQVQESLRDAGIDMEKAQAKLKAVLKERKE